MHLREWREWRIVAGFPVPRYTGARVALIVGKAPLSATPPLFGLMQLETGLRRETVKAVTASAIRRRTTYRFTPSRKPVQKVDRQDTYLKVAKFVREISMLQAVCRPCAIGQAAREACP